MSVTDYLPEAAESYLLPIRRPVELARAAVPALLIMLAGDALDRLGLPYGGIIAMLAKAAATGLFGVAWARLAGLDEAPGSPLHLRFGRREGLYAVWQLALYGFAQVPVIMLQLYFARTEGGEPSLPVVAMTYQTFLLVAGVMFFILPFFALKKDDTPLSELHNSLSRGGLAVGAGMVVVELPYTILPMVLEAILPGADSGMIGAAVRDVADSLLTLVDTALVAAYLALAWNKVKAKAG